MVASLRPGYQPPTRKCLSNELLDKMENKISTDVAKRLKDKSVTLIQDGWSNIHNQPVLANCLSDGENVYFLSAIDTGTSEKTAQYCKQIASDAIKEAETKFKCQLRAFVSDNEAKMKKMRQDLETEKKGNGEFFIAYGCAAHYLNLLGGDICKKKDIAVILGHISELSKYFRNHHKANALLLKQKGSRKPQLPGDTRWNSQVDCLNVFLKNRPYYLQLLTENDGDHIDDNIHKIITNVALFVDAKHLYSQLSCISEALDELQKDTANIADATYHFLNLQKQECLIPYSNELKKRFDECITPKHKLAYILHPRYLGANLDDEQIEEARVWAQEISDDFLPLVTLFALKQKPFPQSFFTDQMVNLNPVVWWEGLRKYKAINNKFIDFVIHLQRASASSAGIERIFSNLTFIQSKLRNKLGLEKCSKLVSVYRMLNLKTKTLKMGSCEDDCVNIDDFDEDM